MSIFDILGDAVSGGLGGNLGNSVGSILETITGQAKSAQSNFNRNLTSEGGLGSMLGAGALGALLGNVAGGSLLKNAALLGAGAVALNFYKKWAQGQQDSNQPQMDNAVGAVPQLDQRTMELITRSMVYAARSDGNIDAEERNAMNAILANMAPGFNMQGLIRQIEKEPIDPARIASEIRNPEQSDDVYRLSCSVIDIDQFMERNYLDALAKALRINDAEKNSIEKEAANLRRQLLAQAR